MTSMPPPSDAEGWDGSWAYTAAGGETAAGRGGPTDPLSRRLLRLAAVLSVLLISVVVNAVLHGGDENPFNPIAAAAQRTRQLPGSRAAVEAIYTSSASSDPVVATGSEVYNARTGRSRAVLNLPSPRLGLVKMESIGDDRSVYLRSSAISSELPPGRTWMEIQPWLGQSAETAMAGNGDADGDLEMLRAVSDEFDSLGSEEVRGVPTKRYSSTIDLTHYAGILESEGKRSSAQEYERLAEQMPEPVRTEVWIDSRGLLRRLRIVMDLPTQDGQPAITMDMRIEFVRFGITPHVRLPKPSRVFDATPLVQAQLHLLSVQSVARSVHLAAGRPLSPSELRRRSNAICAAMLNRARALAARGAPQLRALKSLGPGATPHAAIEGERRLASVLLEPAIRAGESTLRRLARLTPPAELRADYHRLLTLVTLTLDLTRAQTRALEIGEFGLNRTLSAQRKPIARRADRSARQLGLRACVEDPTKPS